MNSLAVLLCVLLISSVVLGSTTTHKPVTDAIFDGKEVDGRAAAASFHGSSTTGKPSITSSAPIFDGKEVDGRAAAAAFHGSTITQKPSFTTADPNFNGQEVSGRAAAGSHGLRASRGVRLARLARLLVQ